VSRHPRQRVSGTTNLRHLLSDVRFESLNISRFFPGWDTGNPCAILVKHLA